MCCTSPMRRACLSWLMRYRLSGRVFFYCLHINSYICSWGMGRRGSLPECTSSINQPLRCRFQLPGSYCYRSIKTTCTLLTASFTPSRRFYLRWDLSTSTTWSWSLSTLLPKVTLESEYLLLRTLPPPTPPHPALLLCLLSIL